MHVFCFFGLVFRFPTPGLYYCFVQLLFFCILLCQAHFFCIYGKEINVRRLEHAFLSNLEPNVLAWCTHLEMCIQKSVQLSWKSCNAHCISGGSYFGITIALNYSIWWLVIHCCTAPNSSSPPFGFALNAWMQNEWCTNRCDVVHWNNSHV